ncbi:putative thioltransferase [Phlyctochytrium arcticum]|nr:putative thioltransferase [Phlyctochytrium arcticum]
MSVRAPDFILCSQQFMNFLRDLSRRLFQTPTPEVMAAAKVFVEAEIKAHKTVVFSKSYCPYCDKAKALLKSLNAEFTAYEMDQRDDGSALQQYLQEKTGQRTVPNIFIAEKHIGGCDDLHNLHKKGDLKSLL